MVGVDVGVQALACPRCYLVFRCHSKLKLGLQLNRNRRLNARMRVVADEFKILVFEVVDVFHRGIDFHLRQRARLAGELEFGLFQMI